ncbi:hypothetical protein QCA50_003148 [Cerrena zonata]|uniref:Uncharacterized protein n=1 Tax=Cerrena zonata TaxID=2478898 RepID=A0AAW0GVM5_9APHY
MVWLDSRHPRLVDQSRPKARFPLLPPTTAGRQVLVVVQVSRPSVTIGASPSAPAQEPDLDEQLLVIIKHISSETTGAMHKEGITELHHFLKAHPHKKAKVDKMLESTGPAFRKYITRALASRAVEDEERNVTIANTLSKLESNTRERTLSSSTTSPIPTSPRSPARSSIAEMPDPQQEKLSRLHDLFQYRSSTASNGSSHGRSTPTTFTSRLPPPS